MKYRLSELVEKLQQVMGAPVAPEIVEQGKQAVFFRVKDKDGNVKIVRQDVEIEDLGSYLMLTVEI